MEELARGPDQWSFEEEERAAQEAAAREADRQMTPAMMMLAKQQAQDKPKEEKKVRAYQQNCTFSSSCYGRMLAHWDRLSSSSPLTGFRVCGLQEEGPLTPEEAEAKDTQAKRDVFADLNLHTLRYVTGKGLWIHFGLVTMDQVTRSIELLK